MESRRPFVTMILVGMNVAVFGAMVLGGIWLAERLVR